MPGVFVGSTELTTVGDIKIGGTDVQEVYVGATKVFPLGDGLPTPNEVFDPENGDAITGSFTRATSAWYRNASNIWTDVGSGNARVAHVIQESGQQGYLIEPAVTVLNTFRRDLTNAVWTGAGSPTIALDATGIDGAANACTTFTAGANNDTLIRDAVTSGSAAHTFQPFIRRVTGTGTVEITIDNGSTWVDVTSDVTSVFSQVLAQQTLSDPQIGFRLGTSGDAIEIDGALVAAVAFSSSPILGDDTTTPTRDRDENTSSFDVPANQIYTILCSFTLNDQVAPEDRCLIGLSNSSRLLQPITTAQQLRSNHVFAPLLTVVDNFTNRRSVAASTRNAPTETRLSADIGATDTEAVIGNDQANNDILIGNRSGGSETGFSVIHRIEFYFQELDEATVDALIARMVSEAPP